MTVHFVKLCTVYLWFALINENAVGQVGDVAERYFIGAEQSHQFETRALECRVAVCVLDEEPGGLGPICTNQALRRPAKLRNNLLHARGVSGIYKMETYHFLEIVFARREPRPRVLINVPHGQKFFPQVRESAGRPTACWVDQYVR